MREGKDEEGFIPAKQRPEAPFMLRFWTPEKILTRTTQAWRCLCNGSSIHTVPVVFLFVLSLVFEHVNRVGQVGG